MLKGHSIPKTNFAQKIASYEAMYVEGEGKKGGAGKGYFKLARGLGGAKRFCKEV